MSRLREACAVALAVCGLVTIGTAGAAEGFKRVDAGAAGLPLLFFDVSSSCLNFLCKT